MSSIPLDTFLCVSYALNFILVLTHIPQATLSFPLNIHILNVLCTFPIPFSWKVSFALGHVVVVESFVMKPIHEEKTFT